jgi:hypothetical protein
MIRNDNTSLCQKSARKELWGPKKERMLYIPEKWFKKCFSLKHYVVASSDHGVEQNYCLNIHVKS